MSGINLKQLLFEIISNYYNYEKKRDEVEYENGRFDYLDIEYSFKTENYKYGVNVSASSTDQYMEAKFGVHGKNMKSLTNVDNVYKVIKTVMKILQEVGTNWGSYFRGFKFYPAKKEGEQGKPPNKTSRGKVFSKYFKETFPTASIETKGDSILVNIG